MSSALRRFALTLNERTGRILSVLPIFMAG
jgi:hypothetical protein